MAQPDANGDIIMRGAFELTPEQAEELRAAFTHERPTTRAQFEALHQEIRMLQELLYSEYTRRFATPDQVDWLRAEIRHRRRLIMGLSLEPLSARAPHLNKRQAKERSKQLLLSCLSPGQRRQFEQDGAFTVVGQKSKKHYIILPTRSFNVIAGKWSFCAGPRGVPIYDYMLAQKLLIETDERAFLSRANKGVWPASHSVLSYARQLRAEEHRHELLAAEAYNRHYPVRPIVGTQPHFIPRRWQPGELRAIQHCERPRLRRRWFDTIGNSLCATATLACLPLLVTGVLFGNAGNGKVALPTLIAGATSLAVALCWLFNE